jgi:hypothetical protein
MITVYIVKNLTTGLYQGQAYWAEFNHAKVYQDWELPAVIRALEYESDRGNPFEWKILPYELMETP